MCIIYAKSNPVESLKEHTDELLRQYEKLRNAYGIYIQNERVWELLKIAIHYHDAGKVYGPFQQRISDVIGIPYKAKTEAQKYLPHNYLSPFFLPLEKLSLTRFERKVLIQAIAYHHERDHELNFEELREAIELDLVKKQDLVRSHLEIPVPDQIKLSNRVFREMEKRIVYDEEKIDEYLFYVLVKGLLHRIDHAASGHIDIEVGIEENIGERAVQFLLEKGSSLRDVQLFAKEQQGKNAIIVAQTGMGKTEAALLWIGNQKAFFTLPLRVSINALFDRVFEQMGFEQAGLLHSTSSNYLDETGKENWEVIYDQSKNFASKLLFTTIDQILKFPFKYRGYEKLYATMAYSVVVIDEIQAYEPKIVAVLIKALEMIKQIGGRFLIMTATLPTLYVEALESRGVIKKEDYVFQTFVNDDIRHRIAIYDQPMSDYYERIAESGKKKKVLVIVNTVKQAVEVYSKLCKLTDQVSLLHSMFIQEDRSILEEAIKAFDKDRNQSGIWVTTQLVEASIDIDFDELYTEVATLDSLFQRFGRCYRRRLLDHDNPNIFIFTKDASGIGYIYDQEIVLKSIEALSLFHEKVIKEKEKVELVANLYKRESLKNTKFLKEFDHAMRAIDSITDHELTNKEAQNILRDIQAVLAIPRKIFDEYEYLFDQLAQCEDRYERMKLRKEIERKTVSITKARARGNTSPILKTYRSSNGKEYPLLPYIEILDLDYDFDKKTKKGTGVSLTPSLSPFV
ncbi:CRISPR-associated helicase/endonuclease Cas3 [Aeribacillus pallidus]|uniref:CRISPR-associated helicase/endonuclease Cas3 n=1 Tax=Aeribacillus pallidus TaxID=33936 RepID=A0A165Y1C4_9BACI|nr:CRISPR-associated helicase/endonuclease Cas3 [Aeribacillus pallidus]KZN96623.1 CRISPR-associated helicase/endonuclease Cas3 [Aeribacillus pallidus]